MNPADHRTPGQLIQALLDERGWSGRILAAVLEMEESGVSKILSARKSVTPETAIGLEEVFGIPAEQFLLLQRELDLAQARIVTKPNPARAMRAQIFAGLPVAEMIKRQWLVIENAKDIAEVERSVAAFFGVGSIASIEAFAHSAKKTSPEATATPAQMAWMVRVKQVARMLLAPPYLDSYARTLPQKLQPLLSAPEEARHVPRLLLEHGIRIVFVEGLKSSKIDGVCMWLDESAPVIGLTGRYDRMDNFWFVLRHELEHVFLGHGQTSPMLDVDLGVHASISEEEILANSAASEFCAPSQKIDSFIARKAPLFPERDFLGLAKILGVHPSLVAGQIQFKTGRYDLFRGHLAKIRDHVLPSAVVDGWGDVAPV